MNTLLRASYGSNGEWLQLYTTPVQSGAMDVIQPIENDLLSVVEPEETPEASDTRVIDLSVGRTWVEPSSETGTFEIMTPSQEYEMTAFPLADWMLTFHGLPRAHNRIRRDVMAGIFGAVGLEIIDEIFEGTRPNHESIGDLRALQRTPGPLTSEQVAARITSDSSLTIERDVPDDLNLLARAARQRFVAQAVNLDRQGGVVKIPKAALILPQTAQPDHF